MEQQIQENNNIHETQNVKNNTPVTVKQWLLTLLLMAIPIVNIVLLFVWAFDSDTNPSKKNFAKAYLIFFAILLVIWIIVVILLIVIGLTAFNGYNYYNTILF